VLTLAQRRGRAGVHSSDFEPGQTADGGPPIRRLAARVDELRNLGHRFNTRKRSDRTVEYVLIVIRGDDELLAEYTAHLEDLAVDVGEQLPDARLFDEAYEQDRARERPGFYDWDGAE
jgi:hypothetical protein